MYTKGRQYPYEGWDGNQIKCQGKNTMIDNIRTPHTIEYEEDTWLIGETELLAGKDNLMDFKKKRILKCQPDSNTCMFNHIRYSWIHRKPQCPIYALKNVRGLITTVGDEKYFTSDNDLIHLKLNTPRIRRCDRNMFSTDFDDIYLLDLNDEREIDYI